MDDPVEKSHRPVPSSLRHAWGDLDPFQPKESWEEIGSSLLNLSGLRQPGHGEWKDRYGMEGPGTRSGLEISIAQARRNM